MQIKIIGIDISLVKTGFAIIKDNGTFINSGVIRSKPSGDKPIDELKRIVRIAEDIMEKINPLLPHHGDILVVIEGLAFGVRNATALTQLSGLNYLLRSLLLESDIPFIICQPTTLKKFITGSGKGEKDKMMMNVFKNYGFEAFDNNVCDAASLAFCGAAVIGKPIKKLGVPQQEVVNLLKKQL